jgi:hypothetical protein
MAYLYHLLDADADAQRVAASLETFAEDYATGPGDWALAALAVGNETDALEWLRRSVARPTIGPDRISINIIALNPYADPVLDRPEFVEVRNVLSERLGRSPR